MNEVIKTILAHRSVRHFADKKLTKEQIETIVACAQRASTSSYIQAYSIIGVTDEEKKKKIAELSGNQDFVAESGHLLIFCADFYRHAFIGELEGVDVIPTIETTEKFMVGLIDAAIAAQNAAIAAESMGLGICYIGGLRNNLPEVCKLLEIPERVIPLFGLVIGYPAKINEQKPRLPLAHVYHENTYVSDKDVMQKQLDEYNQTVRDYYIKRTGGKRADTWTGQMAKTLAKPTRTYMHDFVREKGFDRR
ncbi:MAG: oxygen-insensitive NADPH nitroreductase [Caldibacillus sp.]